jgi:outer membrane lipopolysaccharide assembly protein LptE/RlpB
MLMNRSAAWAALLLLPALVAGCGIYSFSGSSLPSHIKTIAVPIMENKTLDYQVANEATEAITQRFIQDNRLKVVGEGRADCVLEGEISSYENKVYNYSASQSPEDYIVVIRVAATLRDAVKNREIWKQDPITVSAVYSVVPGSAQELKTEADARRKAIQNLAEDVLARTMEQW